LSHNKERAQKVCLNCSTEIIGRYCHACGQENVEPRESLWHLVTHYAYDITHFDGKFFSTLKYLLIRPGYLPGEYLKGKRASYLHPIRMYVFTSAIFFLIVFSMFHIVDMGEGKHGDGPKSDTLHIAGVNLTGAGLPQRTLKNAETKEDSAAILEGMGALEKAHLIAPADASAVDANDSSGTSKPSGAKKNGKKEMINFGVTQTKFKTAAAYDSAQLALPPGKRDGWVERRLNRRNIEIWNKYDGDVKAILDAWAVKFTHTIPQLLFLSLPLFSFVLWLLYIRWKQAYFYTGHIIFSLYLYIFYFLAYLLFFGLQALHSSTHWKIWRWAEFILWLYMLYYMYKAMRNFYQQRRLKTFVKLVLLSFASMFVMAFLFALFMVLSAFTV
jgi:hypothetical protein